ncbi:MAG: type II secretion system protein [Candidatus Riflemargulisbacteria bacterium]
MMLRKAFTLIELLIVMTVIAILAGILIPSFRGYQSEAWIIKAEGDIGALQLGIEAYFRKHTNEYPDSLEDLLEENPRFITTMPFDPFKTDGKIYGYEIVYKTPGNEPFYVIYSQGPNRVKNWSWNATRGFVVMESSSDDIIFTNARLQ